MEELISQQIAQLREEQARLEQELQTHQQGSATTLEGTANGRKVTEISVNRVGIHTDSSIAAAASFTKTPRTTAGVLTAECTAQQQEGTMTLSLHERLQQLEALKRKYQRQASKAMHGYFSAVSDYPSYQAKREETMRSTKPFSFQSRELTRPTRIRERRIEEERQQREREERGWRENTFKAAPVPPTTFMNKYDLMVEEWCERKAAAALRARELADAAREEAAFVRLSAQSLRHTREELMGAVYDPRTGRAITRDELRRKRAQSADAAVARGIRAITQPEDIPLEVKMKLWPAIKDHEQVRHQRIKLTAAAKKKETDAHFTAVMPLLSSPNPHQLLALGGSSGQAFGVGQPIAQQQSQTQTQAPAALGSPAPPPAPGVATAAPATTNPSAAPASPAMPTATAAVAAPKGSGEAVDATKARSRSRSRSADPYNPNLTFKPNVKPGVPDYKSLWAEEKVQLLERKKSRPPTTPKPFGITISEREKIVRGKRASRAVSQPHKRRAPSAAAIPTTKPVTSPAPAQAKKATETAPATLPASSSPHPSTARAAAVAAGSGSRGGVAKGTRAHALRTEAVYAKYIQQASRSDEASAEDDAFLKEAAKRRKEVALRLSDYLADARTEHEHVIRTKVRSLRAAMKENEEAAQQRLQEMRSRVAQMPPLFAEPVGVNDESKARAEAEQEVVGLLKQSGLDAATIRDILVKPAGGEEGKNTSAAEDTATAEREGEGKVEEGVDGEKKDSEAEKVEGPTQDVKKSSTPRTLSSSSSSSASSSSASDSSSDSSSGSSSPPKKSPAASTLSVPHVTAAAVAMASVSTNSALPVPTPSASVGSVGAVSPAAASLPVPAPVPVPKPKDDADYGDDSFEASSSDSDSS